MKDIRYAWRYFSEWETWSKLWHGCLVWLFMLVNLGYALNGGSFWWLNAAALVVLVVLTPVTWMIMGDTLRIRHSIQDRYARYDYTPYDWHAESGRTAESYYTGKGNK